MPEYTAPPIVEAALELRFGPIDDDLAKKAFGRCARSYESKSDGSQTAYSVNADTGELVQETTNLYRAASLDQTDVLIVSRGNFIVARTAPYPGWESFCARILRDWRAFTKATSYLSLTRVGLRYINRIDIEQYKEGVAAHEEYLNFYPKIPEVFELVGNYQMKVALVLEKGALQANVGSATLPPQIPGNNSFALDIDVYQIDDLPAKVDDLPGLLELMRETKNKIFEAAISNKVREKIRVEAADRA